MILNSRVGVNALEWLRNEQMIDIEGNSQYTRIKVLNWGIYQTPDQDVSNNQETVSKQSLDTNKNDKNDKKKKMMMMMTPPVVEPW